MLIHWPLLAPSASTPSVTDLMTTLIIVLSTFPGFNSLGHGRNFCPVTFLDETTEAFGIPCVSHSTFGNKDIHCSHLVDGIFGSGYCVPNWIFSIHYQHFSRCQQYPTFPRSRPFLHTKSAAFTERPPFRARVASVDISSLAAISNRSPCQ